MPRHQSFRTRSPRLSQNGNGKLFWNSGFPRDSLGITYFASLVLLRTYTHTRTRTRAHAHAYAHARARAHAHAHAHVACWFTQLPVVPNYQVHSFGNGAMPKSFQCPYWHCTTPQTTLLSFIVALCICRAARKATRRPRALSSMPLLLNLVNSPDKIAVRTTNVHWTVQKVLDAMKINWFPTDYCTDIIRGLMGEFPAEAFANAYVLSVCTSREFARAFKDAGAGGISDIFNKLDATWAHMQRAGIKLHRSFTKSFRPQCIWRNQWANTKHNMVAKKIKATLVSRSVKPLITRKKDHTFKTKKAICKELRDFRSMGPALAKNWRQFYSLTPKHLRPAVPDDKMLRRSRPGGSQCLQFPQSVALEAQLLL